MNVDNYPTELNGIVGAEKIDFAIKSGRSHPRSWAIIVIIFGLFWGLPVLFMVTEKISSREPINASMLAFLMFGGLLLLSGWIVAHGISMLYRKGSWFIGTPTRMIIYQDDKMRTIDWNQFSGDIEIKGNNYKADITMLLKTGGMIHYNHRSRYFSDRIDIYDIQDGFDIEKLCRQRIIQNEQQNPNRTPL